MTDVFARYLLSKADFTDEELSRIQAAGTVKSLRKRELLHPAGEVWQYYAFVSSGCLRTYSIDAKGAEHILRFAVENWWVGDQESLASGQPSHYHVDAIEPSTVVLWPREEFVRLRREIPRLDELVNAILYRSFIAAQSRIHTAISYSAEEKYREFLRQFPGLALRIPQHMVASYLGMTTETLSRIRRHL